ncbi:MAG: ATP-binding protein, partial [Kofleriaceae bacterium]
MSDETVGRDERYRMLVDSIDQGFCEVEVVTGESGRVADLRFVEVNRAFERRTGMTAVLGRTLRELVADVEPRWFELFGQVAVTGEPRQFTETLAALGRTFRVDAFRVHGAPTTRVAALFEDVTVRQRAEAAARVIEERQAFSLELSDALRPLADPREVQQQAARLLRRQLDTDWAYYAELDPETSVAIIDRDQARDGVPSLIGRHALEQFPGIVAALRAGDQLAIEDLMTSAMATEEGRRRYRTIGVRAVAAVPVMKNGIAISAIVAIDRKPRVWTEAQLALIEATAERTWAAVERARAEATLRQTEQRLQLALDASNMGTFVWHIAENRKEPDARMAQLFGFAPGASPQVLAAAIHPDDRARARAALDRAIDRNGTGTLREDIRVMRPDGSEHWLAITAQTVFEGDARDPVRLVGIASDVTERKHTEAILREREERLRDSDRRKDEFLAVLSHELRNPLAPVRTGLEIIRLAGNSPAAVEQLRAMMERQLGHMVRLIDDLLDVSRITSGKIRLQRQTVELSTLLSTAIESARAAIAEKQLALSVDMPAARIVLEVDPTRFIQVVSNVLHNAIKFTEPSGNIAIRAEATDDEVVLAVTDSGVGITPSMLPRVFDLFSQDDHSVMQRSNSGLGIGLALARRLVELHGGSIEARSDGHGHGATFEIRVPRSGAGTIAAPPRRADRVTAVRRRVVVIDDNQDAANSIAMLVELVGCQASVSYDGASGL